MVVLFNSCSTLLIIVAHLFMWMFVAVYVNAYHYCKQCNHIAGSWLSLASYLSFYLSYWYIVSGSFKGSHMILITANIYIGITGKNSFLLMVSTFELSFTMTIFDSSFLQSMIVLTHSILKVSYLSRFIPYLSFLLFQQRMITVFISLLHKSFRQIRKLDLELPQ